MGAKLRFTVPGPTASKNSRDLVVLPGGRPRSFPNKRAKQAVRTIRAAAVQEINALRRLVPELEHMDTLLGPDDEVSVTIWHDVRAKTITVEVEAIGPKPKKPNPNGRGRDIDNYASTVMDALNGIAYGDDRQVGLLEVRRIL